MKARLLIAICVTAAIAVVEGQSDVPYPMGYRDWHHVKSMVIEEGHPLFEAFGGIHHIYANDDAVTGYQDGRFPDGAVIAFDLLEAVRADNAVTEGVRTVLGVMHKDSERYPATGGWGLRGIRRWGRRQSGGGRECRSRLLFLPPATRGSGLRL